jgi:hypothetical protein
MACAACPALPSSALVELNSTSRAPWSRKAVAMVWLPRTFGPSTAARSFSSTLSMVASRSTAARFITSGRADRAATVSATARTAAGSVTSAVR